MATVVHAAHEIQGLTVRQLPVCSLLLSPQLSAVGLLHDDDAGPVVDLQSHSALQLLHLLHKCAQFQLQHAKKKVG